MRLSAQASPPDAATGTARPPTRLGLSPSSAGGRVALQLALVTVWLLAGGVAGIAGISRLLRKMSDQLAVQDFDWDAYLAMFTNTEENQ